MKKFLFLSYGFETPTPEIMEAWGKWLDSIKEITVDPGSHFSAGREISEAGTKDLPMGMDSITGYLTFNAADMDEAVKIAEGCPIIASNRVYEIMSK